MIHPNSDYINEMDQSKMSDELASLLRNDEFLIGSVFKSIELGLDSPRALTNAGVTKSKSIAANYLKIISIVLKTESNYSISHAYLASNAVKRLLRDKVLSTELRVYLESVLHQINQNALSRYP